MLTDEMQQMIARFPLGFVATVTSDGAPRVSPKGTFLVLDAVTIGFADIRSPGTRANLRHRAEAEVNFIDPFARKALRVRGPVRSLAKGSADFAARLHPWAEVWADLAPRISGLHLIDVVGAGIVTTPPYDDGATEAQMIALYKQKFAAIYP